MLAVAHMFAAALLSFGLVEIGRRLPLAAAATRVLRPVKSAQHVMMAKAISDHWKERVLLVYARQTLLGVGGILAVLSALLIPAIIAIALLDLPLPGFAAFMMSFPGIVLTCGAAGLYLKLRRHMCHAVLQ